MRSLQPHRGFSLLTAIFLLVVVAGLMGYLVNLRINQQTTVVMAVEGARALQAARAGVEYGAFRALDPTPVCLATDTLTFSGITALSGFSVTVNCSSISQTEGASTFDVFTIVATATKGSYARGANANPDFISRQLRLVVSPVPP